MLRTTTVLLLACLALSPTTLAAECNGEITEIIVEDGSPAGQGIYIDDRRELDNHPLSIWTYKEDNTRGGLQSGGWDVICPDDGSPPCGPIYLYPYDPCWSTGPPGPDLLVW